MFCYSAVTYTEEKGENIHPVGSAINKVKEAEWVVICIPGILKLVCFFWKCDE